MAVRGALRVAAGVAAIVVLAGCGDRSPDTPDPAAMAAGGIMSQLALFCPGANFSWDTFDAAAKSLGAGPDGGEVRKAPTVTAGDVVRERWVALTQSGRRTTVWIGEIGPGVRYQDGVAPVPHASGLVCMAHDPALTREEARDLIKPWKTARVTGAVKTGPGDLDLEARQWTMVQHPGSGVYQDVQMYAVEPEFGGGAMLTRHRFVRTRDGTPTS